MIHRSRRISILFFTLLTVVSGCAAERQYDDYGLKSVADLTLTQDNHPHGYSQSQCFVCHLPENIHRVDRLKAPSFPLAAREAAEIGLSSCVGCHGANGVSP